MTSGDVILWLIAHAGIELALFAAVGLLVGGLDDLAVDLVWIVRSLWAHLFVYRRTARMCATMLPAPEQPGRIAVFVPAWDEGDVIGAMLARALERFDHHDYRIFVGIYPNDPATIAAVEDAASRDGRIVPVVQSRPGPTTKADNLNHLWHRLNALDAQDGTRFKAIVLHDAEDLVHPAELRLFDLLIERFDLVQLPVLPLPDRNSRWVGGHYMDEFAESHGKQLVVREAIGASMPSAGVGCALSRRAVERLAELGDGKPFAADSLTEDYEVGLRLGDFGWHGIFVRMPVAPGRGPVAVRAYFPGTLEAAIRQKTRWITGIALSGWDRLGWRGHAGDLWMRLRDRRSLLAALFILAAYASLVLGLAAVALGYASGRALPAAPDWIEPILGCNLALLLWRGAMRFVMVARVYGWREGLRALPRILVANFILIASARRAARQYIQMHRDGIVAWDKTSHRFPDVLPAE